MVINWSSVFLSAGICTKQELATGSFGSGPFPCAFWHQHGVYLHIWLDIRLISSVRLILGFTSLEFYILCLDAWLLMKNLCHYPKSKYEPGAFFTLAFNIVMWYWPGNCQLLVFSRSIYDILCMLILIILVTIIARTCLITADILLIIITWARLYRKQIFAELTKPLTFERVLIHNGMLIHYLEQH